MSRISGAPQPLSSGRPLQGVFLLNLRVTYAAEQVFFITSVGSQLSFSGHSLEEKGRAEVSLSRERDLDLPCVCGSGA